jgi:hypothetical protein
MKTVPGVKSIVVAALVLVTAPLLFAQSAGAPPDRSDGIKVHGHWTIDVMNPDGSLAGHYEFENALANHLGASTFLNGVLARTKRVGRWQVSLPDSNGQPLIWVVEPGTPGFAADSQTLAVTTPTTGPNAGKLVLSGNGTAPRAAQINFVQSQTDDCPPPGEAGACTTSAFAFSQKNLTTAIPVAQGQIVQLTVVFSFS